MLVQPMNTHHQLDFELTDQETVDLIRRLEKIDQKSSVIASVAEATGRSEEEVRQELALMRQEKEAETQVVERSKPLFVIRPEHRFAFFGVFFFFTVFAVFLILAVSLTARPARVLSREVLPPRVDQAAPSPAAGPVVAADAPPAPTEDAARASVGRVEPAGK